MTDGAACCCGVGLGFEVAAAGFGCAAGGAVCCTSTSGTEVDGGTDCPAGVY
jgi:hypothetical protein